MKVLPDNPGMAGRKLLSDFTCERIYKFKDGENSQPKLTVLDSFSCGHLEVFQEEGGGSAITRGTADKMSENFFDPGQESLHDATCELGYISS